MASRVAVAFFDAKQQALQKFGGLLVDLLNNGQHLGIDVALVVLFKSLGHKAFCAVSPWGAAFNFRLKLP